MTRMRSRAKVVALSLVGAGLLVTATANSATYFVQSNSSSLDDLRKIGGANIPEIATFTGFGGSLDPKNPANWPGMINNIQTWNPATPSVAPTSGGANSSTRVSGTVNIVGGAVTAATLNQLDPLSVGMFQSYTQPNGPGVLTNMITNGLVWTFNPLTNQLNHQTGGGTYAACTVAPGGSFGGVSGTQTSGQCSQLAAAVNASGAFGQFTIGNSYWNWDGMASNYAVNDGQTTPWHTGLGAIGLGIGPQQGVIWDTSGFVDGVGGVVTAIVTANVLTGNNATGVAGFYSLNLVPVPVPAAVWLFGGAMVALGALRRKAATN